MAHQFDTNPRYAEFFAGGGMVSAALRDNWSCALANDVDPMKCATFRANWPDGNLIEGDIRDLPISALYQPIDLYWASSPCQDFSLAGAGAGLQGKRSSVVTPWLDLVESAVHTGFSPKIIAFENVVGMLSRDKGTALWEVLRRIIRCGYRVGALNINAQLFVPQSRPRIFVIAVRNDIEVSPDMLSGSPVLPWHDKPIMRFVERGSARLRQNWLWWNLPLPTKSVPELSGFIEAAPTSAWFSQSQTRAILQMMDDKNLEKVHAANKAGKVMVGTLYKRGRPGIDGTTRQRAEVRFDGIAGCLRTPAGGSSRQTLVFVDGQKVRMRLLDAREALSLMGLPRDYIAPQRYNDAYKVAGDGVVVPVVEHLDRHLFRPLVVPHFAAVAA
ncbi:DNA cytosine methyltransferase [Marivita sp. S6314]|uniref:DNA cytosine methyltransferase n=1 Tax=Marivita sp. S6314 TaxID=2926406 RepID=UPI001FF34E49|nr:DNA cytosine methyltransferase [Marivita sp. S6314]MCK0148688.1 DNA cytosine methyltransferase [Marivita sp. S6314]